MTEPGLRDADRARVPNVPYLCLGAAADPWQTPPWVLARSGSELPLVSLERPHQQRTQGVFEPVVLLPPHLLGGRALELGHVVVTPPFGPWDHVSGSNLTWAYAVPETS